MAASSSAASPRTSKPGKNSADEAEEETKKKVGFWGRKVSLRDELHAARHQLQGSIDELRDQFTEQMAALRSRLDEEATQWRAAVDSERSRAEAEEGKNRLEASDAVAACQRCTEEATGDCATKLKVLREEVDGLGRDTRRLEEASSSSREAMLDRLASQGKELRIALLEMKAELVEVIDEVRSLAASAREELRADVLPKYEAALADVSNELAVSLRLTHASSAEMAEAVGRQRDLNEAQAREAAKVKEDISWLRSHIDRIEGLLHARIPELLSNEENANTRIMKLEASVQRAAHSATRAEGLSTRRVEWVISDALVQLTPLSLEERSPSAGAGRWRSPAFEAAGLEGLQLELGLCQDDAEGPAGLLLRLWSPERGLTMVCRLYIGGVSSQVQHVFDGEAPCTTGRLCALQEQINPDDGSLRVGAEVLEAVRELAVPGAPEAEPDPAGGVRGSMVLYRYLNHRTLDQVRSQVEVMRSRLVRRVEWRLERATSLRRCFAEGESLGSTLFAAAGVEGMQFVFYPSGHVGAKDGFCSVFLHCAPGFEIHCWLSAGKQRREARAAPEQPGLLGRTNFCRFDSCIDESDDTILLALDIDEALHLPSSAFALSLGKEGLQAQQGVPEPMTHVLPTLRGEDTPSRLSGASPDSSRHRLASSIKLKTSADKAVLHGVRQLPSIWTGRCSADVGDALDGFKSFNDLKAKRTPSSARGRPHSGAGFAVTPSGGGVHQRYLMYAN